MRTTVIDLQSLCLYGKGRTVLRKYTMYCKQRFAVVVQQVQANILAQLGSNPFQPLPGAIADPTTLYEGLQKNVVLLCFFKEKSCFVLLSKNSEDRVMRAEVCQLDLEPLRRPFPFNHSGDCYSSKGKSTSLISTSKPHQDSFPSFPIWQRATVSLC